MKRLLLLVLILTSIITETAAQQNWAAVPCFELKKGDAIYKILNNDAHNELILCNDYRTEICGTNYVATFAYNGSSFHDMDLGVNVQDPNAWLGGTARIGNCVEYNGKAIITGLFSTVGSDTMPAKNIAVWNGVQWDTFPHPFWSNGAIQASNTNFGIGKLLKDSGKIWMFTGYDTSQNLTFIPVLYDGANFTKIPQIPVNNKNQVIQAVKYHNKLIVTGNFLNFPSLTYFRLAQWDGTSWSEIGNGAPGNLTGVAELTVYNDTLYIAGNFRKSDGCKGNYIMKWDGNQLTDAGFGSWCGYGPVRRLIPFKNRLYAFGGFNCASNQKAFGVAYYENGIWTVPQDSIPNGVADAVMYKDAIYIGGSFYSINGDSTIHQFAKLICPDFDAAGGCLSGLDKVKNNLNLKIFPNPVRDILNVEFDKSVIVEELIISSSLGEELIKEFDPLSKYEMDLSRLAPGIYFITARSKENRMFFKFIKE